MNENNINRAQNTENAYPENNYPQSGYTQFQNPYPQSNMPYSMSEYPEEKRSSKWHIAIISIVAVLIIVLATTLIIVLQRKNQQTMAGMMPPPAPMGTTISISENGATINGQQATIDFFDEDGKAYLKLEDISSTAGYDYVREGNEVKLLSQMELAILEVDSTKVTLQDQTSKETNSVEILKAPFEKDGNVYIYARDLAVFMKNTNVSYNSLTDAVEIIIGAAMGGSGGPPPTGGQMPQAGQVQQNTQQPPVDAQNNTNMNNSAAPQGGQPPQNGQPPQGGQPPQN